MFDKARAHRKHRSPRAKREEIPLLDTTIVTNYVRSISSHHLPKLRKQIEPYLHKGREKLGDAYTSVAQVLAAQKEAFEDRHAERKSRARARRSKK